ncbi:cytochrome c biogenesis protein ResB [Kribbia dieselivorans]|uniref:cytochrome c biogenesis protein ResB n=1 Tax=Kribbia dieselivorans TaxID=331526 RepID=UPI0008393AFF|nr:cytochrome c biogenesis protein ResB [Kribbia dieselivorans]
MSEVTQPRLGFVGYLRWGWRQLTSMRTALFLLLLLSVAAIPGSVFPQYSIDAGRVADYKVAHPGLSPWLERLGMFEVYGTPWFSAIYLLLFISLVGCILPRTAVHLRALRAAPPKAPKRLERLEAHATVALGPADAPEAATDDAVYEAVAAEMKRRRFRVARHDESSVSAEGGYAKETGNLLFHISMLGIIVGVAIGHLYGWKGDVIVPAGQTFTNTLTRYDTFSPGPLVDPSKLSPFTIKVDSMDAHFEETTTGKGQFGQPRAFSATVTTQAEPGAPSVPGQVSVNHPLEMDKASAFLLGNGYAPVITVRDAKGEILYRGATPFLAQDNNYRSVGAIKVPAASPKQLGFVGLFLPTATIDPEFGPVSVFPDTKAPALALSVYEGELFPDGRPQSVYTLDTASMDKVLNTKGTDQLRLWLTPGQTAKLPGGRGSITFDRVERFAGLSIRYDPGKWLTLGSAVLMLVGLMAMLFLRRRRIFARVVEVNDVDGPPQRRLIIGGLTKEDDAALADLVTDLAESVAERLSLQPSLDGRMARS